MFFLQCSFIYFASSMGGSRFAMSSLVERTFDDVLTGWKMKLVIFWLVDGGSSQIISCWGGAVSPCPLIVEENL